jgi:phosphotransferase system enzyme I (PtsI)
MEKLKGVGVSKGIAIGEVFLYLPEEIKVDINERDNIPVSDKKKKFEITKDKSRKELQSIYEKMKSGKTEKEAGIFEAQALFVDDPTLDERIMELIEQGFTLIVAVKKVFGEAAEEMEQMENEYFKQRAKDIRDVSNRLLRHILNKPIPDLSSLPSSSIIVAKDLTPSDTASIDRDNVLGFVTDMGGITSHTAILAEALGIPAIVGLKDITERVKQGDSLIVDGETGKVFINPNENTIDLFKHKKKALEAEKRELEKVKFNEAITKGGKRIEVAANIGSPKDADVSLRSGAEGVGLFRTEFLFLNRNTPPTEDEQFKAYKEVLEKFNGKPVIIRTLDIGGDKQIPYLNLEHEINPFLGVRAIRLCLTRKDLFKTQLRAILRASNYGKTRIMYPMIAVKEEIVEANNVLKEVKNELEKEKLPFDSNIEVGIMVEIPSAALNAEALADYVDFFSIGTNDLTQYTFAADRTNDNLSYLYQPLNPALLKLIKMTVDASHEKGKWTGVCGELAGDPEAIPILVNLGVDELSMSPQKIPYAKKIIMEI